MSPNEFSEWFRYHLRVFPETMAWLSKQPIERILGDERSTQEEIRRDWEKALRGCTLEHCKEATDQMFSGVEELPRFPSSIPREIRRITFKLRGNMPRRSIEESLRIPGESIEFTRSETRKAVQESMATLARNKSAMGDTSYFEPPRGRRE